MKKLMALVLCVALLVCTVSTVAGAEATTKLTLALWDDSQVSGIQMMVDKFMQDNPDITVEIQCTPWAQYWTSLEAAAMGGTLADVVMMHPEKVTAYAEGGMIASLDDLAASGAIDMTQFPQNIVKDFTVDGVKYGVPKDYSTFGLWYNKDLFDAAGLAYPTAEWTWDDLYNAAVKLTDKDAGVYGFIARYDTNDGAYHFIWQNGGDIINADQTASGFDDPATIGAIEYMVKFIQEGLSPTAADLANTDASSLFLSGKAAMQIAGSWMCSTYAAASDMHLDVAELPTGKQRACLCGGMGWVLSAADTQNEAAVKLITYLAGEDANIIQAQSGVAIPAYNGSQTAWVESWPQLNAQAFVNAASYGYSSQYCTTRNDWVNIESKWMVQVFNLEISPEEGCTSAAQEINAVLAK
jgi:multiple sugar transport system substrate-binding protein